MQRAHFVDYRGKQIFLMDCRNATPDEMDAIISECAWRVRQFPDKSALTLTVAGGNTFNSETIAKLKALARDNEPFVKAAAVVGVTGLYKVIFNAVSIFSKRNFHLFATVEEAKDYLAGC